MTELSEFSLSALIAELHRRERALEEELSVLIQLRSPSMVARECSDRGRLIVSEIAAAFGIHDGDIMGRRRTPKIARARQTAMVALYQAGFTLSEVGKFFDRDHGTVIHALKVIKQSPSIP